MPVNESNTIQYTVTTSRVPDGTVLYWKTTGNTTNSDIVGGNTGTITINNNQATFNVTIASDSNTDGTKTLGINLLTGSLSGTSIATTPTPIVINDTSQTPVGYTVTYLAVGGGGAGGYAEPNPYGDGGGGGGAGGYVTSAISFITNTVYTITVGGGGAATNTVPAERGGSGSNTSISSPLGTVVTAVGGGGGGGGNETQTPGSPGGSGGGAGAGYLTPGTGGSGFNFPGPTQQGYPGGLTVHGVPQGPHRNGAGGGGAGSAGGDKGPGTPAGAGAGGSGLTNTISGSSISYAGGGGGGSCATNGSPGPGGSGGGGRGGDYQGGSAVNGSANRGGGGGGGATNTTGSGPINIGGSGGSGVVILTMATANYPGSAPGATVTTNGGNTVLTFTSSGTYTA